MAEQLVLEFEEWRIIDGWPAYAVSNHGRVRRGTRLLKPALTPEGYWAVSLWKNNKGSTKRIPVLVCTAFHGPRPAKHDVAHADGSRTNDCANNLRWATRTENMADAISHGRTIRGTKNPNAKLTEDDARAIKISSKSLSIIAAHYGISTTAVHNIKSGRNWAWL